MTRIRRALLVVAVLAGAATVAGCEKPSEGSCKKAIANMRRLMGTENLRDEDAMLTEVRRCRGGSSKKSVDCAIKAQSLDELRSCDFYKVPANAKGIGDDTGSGSATGSAGSGAGSAMGSAMGDSSGSAMGSDQGSAAGSANTGSAGSGDAGSAAMGSAASGSGSASP